MTQSPANLRQTVPLLGVADLNASLRFYVDGIGFKMTSDWVHDGVRRWCWLALDSVALMIQQFWTDGSHEGRPEGALGQGLRICVVCDDALALYRTLIARGLRPDLPYVGNGAWVVGLADLDGYRFEFESRTDIAEGTSYDPALHIG